MQDDISHIRAPEIEAGTYNRSRCNKSEGSGSSRSTNGRVGITLRADLLTIENREIKGEKESDESELNVFHNRCIQSE